MFVFDDSDSLVSNCNMGKASAMSAGALCNKMAHLSAKHVSVRASTVKNTMSILALGAEKCIAGDKKANTTNTNLQEMKADTVNSTFERAMSRHGDAHEHVDFKGRAERVTRHASPPVGGVRLDSCPLKHRHGTEAVNTPLNIRDHMVMSGFSKLPGNLGVRLKRNPAFANLTAGYLFPEIAKRKAAYAASNPGKKIISLGIGNTTEPLTPHITAGLAEYAKKLGTASGYSGYGDEQGLTALREKIAGTLYSGLTNPIDASEIFVSDGAKCDIARLQVLFGSGVSVAVQDPAYPVYVDGSVIVGAAGSAGAAGYKGITYMPCTEENGFFPALDAVPPESLIYFCSPNNPTGAVATKAQLKTLVDFALSNGCVIVFDAAYYAFIRDPSLPRSIYEIEGAKDCAIEVNSFSKLAGFTGVRLGWSVVPKTLLYADGSPVHKDWSRVMTTAFNGASNIAQAGGLAAMDQTGVEETKTLVDYYLENAVVIKKALRGDNFKKAGVTVYGEGNSPYLWVRFPNQKSWDVFDRLLNDCSIVTTPGAGFGPAGESYIRFSSFGHREDAEIAAERLAGFSL